MLTLSLPNFTVTTPGPTLSTAQQAFLVVISIGLYCAFLAIQTGRHRRYFMTEEERRGADARRDRRRAGLPGTPCCSSPTSCRWCCSAEQLAHPIDYLIETLKVPAPLGGVIIAMLVATPEAISATRSAWMNRVQRSINIFLGSVLSTIGLTVPVMLVISYLTAHEVFLGLTSANEMLLAVTLVVSVVTFASGRTNILQGAVHVVLFAAFVMLIFQG